MLIAPQRPINATVGGGSVMPDPHDFTQEEWRAIPGYEGLYEASNFGRLRSLRFECNERPTPKILTSGTSHNGYARITFRDGRSHSVHRLVLETFGSPRPEGCQAAHQDGNRKNNHISNLRWMTPVENNLQKHQHGTVIAKLTEADVRDIRALSGRGLSVKAITNLYRGRVARTQITRIIRRRQWRHIE